MKRRFFDAVRLLFEAGPRGHIRAHPDDGFDPCFHGLGVELDGAEEISVIGHGERRKAKLLGTSHELIDLAGSVEKAVFGMTMKMNEVAVAHFRKAYGVRRLAFNFKIILYFYAVRDTPYAVPMLFPLDRGRGLGGNIVTDAIDAADFVDDTVGDAAQKFRRKLRPIRRHAIDACNRSQGHDIFICAFITHNSDAFYW